MPRRDAGAEMTRVQIYSTLVAVFGLAYYPLRNEVGDRTFTMITIVYAVVSRLIAERYGRAKIAPSKGGMWPETLWVHGWRSRRSGQRMADGSVMSARYRRSWRLVSILVKLVCFFVIVITPPILVDQPTRSSLGAAPYQAFVALTALLLLWVDRRYG